jgi:hypothetical protein
MIEFHTFSGKTVIAELTDDNFIIGHADDALDLISYLLNDTG